MKDIQDSNFKLIRNLLVEELVKALSSNAPHIKDSQLRVISVSFEDNTYNESETLNEYWVKFREKFASYGYQLPIDLVVNGRRYTNLAEIMGLQSSEEGYNAGSNGGSNEGEESYIHEQNQPQSVVNGANYNQRHQPPLVNERNMYIGNNSNSNDSNNNNNNNTNNNNTNQQNLDLNDLFSNESIDGLWNHQDFEVLF